MSEPAAAKGLSKEILIGIIAISVVVCVWTGFHLFVRVGIQGELNSYDFTTLRMGFAGIVMLPFLIRMGFGGLSFWQVLVLAMFGGPGFALFAFGGYHFAPAVHGGTMLTGTISLFTAPLAWWLAAERLDRARQVALALILCGAFLMVADAVRNGTPGQWIGDFLFMCGSANWSVFVVLMRRWQVHPLRASALVATFSMVLYLPIHLLVFPSNLQNAPLGEILFHGLYQGLIVSLVSVIGYGIAARALGATVTAMCAAAVPGAVAILAFLILGEPLSAPVIGGVALVTLGILFMVVGGRFIRSRKMAPVGE